MTPNRTVLRTLALVVVIVIAGAAPAGAGSAVKAKVVKAGLNGPAAFTLSPKGMIFYLERGTGEVRVLNPRNDNDRLFFRIRGVNGSGERGALGIALHPRFPQKPFVYVYVTRSSTASLQNQIVRIRMEDAKGKNLHTLLSTPASSSPYHNGGRIAFGPDGMLYAIVGDGHKSSNSQDRSQNLRGKILRMRPDGSVPPTNPFGSRIWAYGIRNSFGFAFDPLTDRLWETENGPGCNDEINRIVKGGNFAWGPNESCGSRAAPRDTNNSGPAPRHLPRTWFVSPIGITGAAFCNGCGLRAGVEGDLFFGDVNTGKLRRIVLNGARTDVAGGAITVLDTPRGAIYSMESGPRGNIFFSDFAAIYRLVSP